MAANAHDGMSFIAWQPFEQYKPGDLIEPIHLTLNVLPNVVPIRLGSYLCDPSFPQVLRCATMQDPVLLVLAGHMSPEGRRGSDPNPLLHAADLRQFDVPVDLSRELLVHFEGHVAASLMQLISECNLPFPYKIHFSFSREARSVQHMYENLRDFQPAVQVGPEVAWELPKVADVSGSFRHFFGDLRVPLSSLGGGGGTRPCIREFAMHHAAGRASDAGAPFGASHRDFVVTAPEAPAHYPAIDVLPDLFNEYPRVSSVGYGAEGSPMSYWTGKGIDPQTRSQMFHGYCSAMRSILTADLSILTAEGKPRCAKCSAQGGPGYRCTPCKMMEFVHPQHWRICAASLREYMYHSKQPRSEARQSKCTVNKSLLYALSPPTGKIAVLDVASAYGDRLLASMTCANVAVYVGVDPNEELFAGYEEISRLFLKPSPPGPRAAAEVWGGDCRTVSGWREDGAVFHLVAAPFQTAPLPNHSQATVAHLLPKSDAAAQFSPVLSDGTPLFDVALASPAPYMTETYSTVAGQASGYSSLHSWFIRYMFTSMRRAWDHLRFGGCLALTFLDRLDGDKLPPPGLPCYGAMEQNGVLQVTEVVLTAIEVFCPGAVFAGAVGWRGTASRAVVPFWLFTKTTAPQDIARPGRPQAPLPADRDLTGRAAGLRNVLKTTYPDLYAALIAYCMSVGWSIPAPTPLIRAPHDDATGVVAMLVADSFGVGASAHIPTTYRRLAPETTPPVGSYYASMSEPDRVVDSWWGGVLVSRPDRFHPLRVPGIVGHGTALPADTIACAASLADASVVEKAGEIVAAATSIRSYFTQLDFNTSCAIAAIQQYCVFTAPDCLSGEMCRVLFIPATMLRRLCAFVGGLLPLSRAISYVVVASKIVFPYKRLFVRDYYSDPRAMFERLCSYSGLEARRCFVAAETEVNLSGGYVSAVAAVDIDSTLVAEEALPFEFPLTAPSFAVEMVRAAQNSAEAIEKRSLRLTSVTPADYDNMDVLPDVFSEPARVVSRRVKNFSNIVPSAKLIWEDPALHFAFLPASVDLALSRSDPLTAYHFRESIAYSPLKPEVTQFKATLSRSIVELLTPVDIKSTRWLDFSSGWGDRLFAALSLGIARYVAVDPNPAVHVAYLSAIETFRPDAIQSNAVSLHCSAFENPDLTPSALLGGNDGFDLVFTSPPFFAFELYGTDRGGQSAWDSDVLLTATATGKDAIRKPIIAWMEMYLFVWLRKAWAMLCPGGRLGLYMSDTVPPGSSARHVCYVEATNAFITSCLPTAEYNGVILHVGESGRQRPCWVWTKLPVEADESRVLAAQSTATDALKLLKNYYTDVVEVIGTAS